MTLHRQVFDKYTLFTDVGDRYYITWVSSYLSPSIMLVGQNIYQEGEEIDGFYFMIRGLAAWTLPKMSNMIYSIVDPGRETISQERGRRMKIFQYFGMEDSVMNHLKLLQATKKKKSNTLLKHGEDLLKKRQFTILCLKQSECLMLPMQAIDRMRRDFMSISTRFFKFQINQFNTLIQYH